MLEKHWQQQIVQLARVTGHRVYHTFDSRRSEAGFPDLTIARRGMERLLMVELKTDKGKLTPAQEEWREILESIPGVDYRLWRPADFDEAVITLKGLREG